MLRVHLNDGRTVKVDLNDAEQAKRLLSVVGPDRLSPEVSGLVIASKSAEAAVSIPAGFQSLSFGEAVTMAPNGKGMKGFDRLTMFYDDISVTVLVHAEAPVVTLDVARVGWRRHHAKT